MRRIRFYFGLLAATLLACSSTESEMMAETTAPVPPTAVRGKTLVAYYSYTGNCRSIVNELTKQIEADVAEITPVDKTQRYEADNYAIGTQLLNAIKANPNDASSYPAIDPVSADLNQYSNIIIVTPLWWSQMAAIMQSYLFQNSAQMAGKHVAMVVSSASSGISGVVADAKRLLPDVSWMGDALWINDSRRSRTASLLSDWINTLNFEQKEMETLTLDITIEGKTHSISLEDNAATRELCAALAQSPITYNADDYGGFEKVGALGRSLPTSDQHITTQAGDVILYNGDQIVLFYGSNSWSYTRLGRIAYDSLDELKTFLRAGQGSISVTLSLPAGGASLQKVRDAAEDDVLYTMDGKAHHPDHGFYVRNGKKIFR